MPLKPHGLEKVNSLAACRAYLWARDHAPERAKPLAQLLFARLWNKGLDITPVEAVIEEAAALHLDVDALRTALAGPELKAALTASVEAAVSQGVFGVPTFLADGELFWGTDHFWMLEHWLHWQLVQDADFSRHLELRQMLTAACQDRSLDCRHIGILARNHEGDRHFAVNIIRPCHDGDLGHARRADRDRFDFGRGNTLAANFQHILDPVAELQPAILAQDDAVACAEVTVLVEGLRSCSFVPVVFAEDGEASYAADEQMTGLTRAHLTSVLADDADAIA